MAKKKTDKVSKQPLSREAIASSAFNIACRMEDDVEAARQFVSAIALLCETMDQDGRTEVVQRLAWTIGARIRAVETARCQLFQLAYPIAIGEVPLRAGVRGHADAANS